jgi:hypothetical protein
MMKKAADGYTNYGAKAGTPSPVTDYAGKAGKQDSYTQYKKGGVIEKKAQKGGVIKAMGSAAKAGMEAGNARYKLDSLLRKTNKPLIKKSKNGSSFGMLSVKAGVDKNPKPTAADRIAGAKGLAKKGAKVAKKMMKNGGMLAAPTKGGVSMQLGSYTRQIGKNYTGKNVVNKGAKAKMGKSMGKCKNGC